MSKSISHSILAIAIAAVTGVGLASTASANAGHHNVSSPVLSDTSTVTRDNAKPCYVEPSGFHSNMHWDSSCRDGQKMERSNNERSEAAQPKFVEPDGFHKNIRFK